jgi:hypothetical protein
MAGLNKDNSCVTHDHSRYREMKKATITSVESLEVHDFNGTPYFHCRSGILNASFTSLVGEAC